MMILLSLIAGLLIGFVSMFILGFAVNIVISGGKLIILAVITFLKLVLLAVLFYLAIVVIMLNPIALMVGFTLYLIVYIYKKAKKKPGSK